MKNVTEKGIILNFADFVKHSDTFIETGTCVGTSTQKAFDAGFKTVKTVEAWEPFFLESMATFKDNMDITCFFGESHIRIPHMLEDIDKPCVFFLDAHPAGPGTAGHDDFMEKGEESDFDQNNILVKELVEILKHRKDHVIIIDDQNGDNEANHKYIEFYMQMLINVNPNYKFYFYDEQMGELFTKNKSLVCIPE